MIIRQLLISIKPREWGMVGLLSVVMIVISTAPLLYGLFMTPAGSVFTGIHFTAPNDWFVYYSYIEQVRQGKWFFSDLFASEPHQPVFNPLWLTVGLVASVTKLTPLVAFQLARIVLIPVFYVVAYAWIALLFSERHARMWAVIILSFASGLGVFMLDRIVRFPFNFDHGQFNWPMDLWVPEHNTFLTLYYSPHFIASLALILFIFLITVLFAIRPRVTHTILAGVAGLLLFSFHPFHIPTIWMVLVVFAICVAAYRQKLPWMLFLHIIGVMVIASPAILYYIYLLSTDWVMQQKALQNLTWTTPLWLTFISYGLLLPLAGIGIRAVVKKYFGATDASALAWLFIIAWAPVQFVLLYAPVDFQRRMSEGLHFPLAMLSCAGVLYALNRAASAREGWMVRLHSWRYSIGVVGVALLISSNIFQVSADILIYTDRRDLAYLSRDVVSAATWLRSVEPRAVIFNSTDDIVNVIPSFSGRHVYVGHGVETPDFANKQEGVEQFFLKDRDVILEADYLHALGVTHIFFGPSELRLGTYDPATKPYLREEYKNSSVRIYKVL